MVKYFLQRYFISRVQIHCGFWRGGYLTTDHDIIVSRRCFREAAPRRGGASLPAASRISSLSFCPIDKDNVVTLDVRVNGAVAAGLELTVAVFKYDQENKAHWVAIVGA